MSGEGEDMRCRSASGIVGSSVGGSGHRESVGDEGDVERQSDSWNDSIIDDEQVVCGDGRRRRSWWSLIKSGRAPSRSPPCSPPGSSSP